MQLKVLLTTLFSTAFGTAELCEPDFGTNYTGCDLTLFQEIRSWKECRKICFYTESCVYWTWTQSDSNYRPLTCFLKNKKCRGRPDANSVSGDVTCTKRSVFSTSCLPKYGVDYPGCDMMRLANVYSWRECSRFCLITQGCRQWTWFHKGHRSYPHSCLLKNKTCSAKPLSFAISGDVLTYVRCKELDVNIE